MINIFRLSFLNILFLSINLSAQPDYKTDSIDCDSLSEALGYEGAPIDKLPTLIKSLAEVENEFLHRIDTTNFEETIYVKVAIDTFGNACCPMIIKGNNDYIDTAAIVYVTQLKFTPAELRAKKVTMYIVFPFFGNKVSETSTLVRKNGKWFDKKTN